MRTAERVRTALRAVSRHRLRSASSALGVTAGVGALVAMLAVGQGARDELLAQIAELGTNTLLLRASSGPSVASGVSETSASIEALETVVTRIHGIRDIAPVVELDVLLTEMPSRQGHSILGATEAYFRVRGLALQAGRPLADQDEAHRALVCVLGSEVARGLGPRGHVGNIVTCGGLGLEVIGVLEGRSRPRSTRAAIATRDVDRTVFVPHALAGALGGDRLAGAVHEASLSFSLGRDVDRAASRIRSWAHQGGVLDVPFEVIVPAELLEQAGRTQRVLGIVLGAVAALSLLVGGIGIMNVMLISVTERTHEIGLRRAVGATRADIVAQFLVEALVLTLGGAAIGIVCGRLGAGLVSELAGWPTAVTRSSIALAMGMATLVGLCAGLHPAARAAHVDPAAALRNA